LSDLSIRDWSEGGAYVHNLIAGNIELRPVPGRETPYQVAHGTEMAALKTTKCGDNRYFNNIFVGGVKEKQKNQKSGLGIYEDAELPMIVNGNVYANGARAFKNETSQLQLKYNPEIKIAEKSDGIYLSMLFDKQILKMKNETVTSELLGKTLVSDLPFENPDGSEIVVEYDFFGRAKNKNNPTVGPFEKPDVGQVSLKVWSK
jgi:hypothetical protein